MSRLPTIPQKQFEIKSKYIPKGKMSLIPFTVGLENILIQVKESQDDKERAEAIKQVIQECNKTPDIEIGVLPLFLLEEIFIRLRQNSVGEIIDQQYQCNNTVGEGDDAKPCGTKLPVKIDLRDFKLEESEGHTNTIIIADPIGVKFKYPSIDLFEEADTETSDEIETIISCIDVIFDNENVYNASEYTREELREFWNQLTLKQKEEVFTKFFQSMPHLHYKQELKCPSCGHVHNIEFNSIQEVFQ